MKKTIMLVILSAITLLIAKASFSQEAENPEPVVITGVYHGISRPLRDIPPLTQEEFDALVIKGQNRKRSQSWVPKERLYPFAETALPKGDDPVWQSEQGRSMTMISTLLNFDGQTSPYKPSDVNGDVNQTHYMQTINTVYAIYNKAGQLLAGPTNLNQLFSGVTGSEHNDGDPIVLWDEAAQRWLVAEFSVAGSNDYMLVAVSTTADPTGTWHKYSFDVDDMPDYPKLGVWHDGYYMGTNTSTAGRKDIYVIERAQMLNGGTARMIGFKNTWRPNSGFHCVPPLDADGTLPAPGSPGIFITINDDAWGGSDQIWIYELAANWTTPTSSTFTRTQQINVPSFDSNFGSTWDNIVQKGTTQKLDAVNQVIMHRPQYRNFGSYETVVACHTVDVNNTDRGGVRWYELRRTGGTGSWTVRQSGTYSPDSHSRWMASIAMTPSGKIGLMYSISSSTLNPGIRFTGQSAAAYTAGNGIMDIPEGTILEGTLSQTGTNRWGDYFMLSVDPSDNETFWATAQYVGSGNASKTRIATFKIGNAPIVQTTAATNITTNSATINGTVNPNTLSTTYYFEWGTSISYGSTTSAGSVGSGSTAQSVSASLSSLAPGTTYHYRIVATNADGTSYGENMTFSPGGAQLTTTPISGVQTNSAISGGNITSDGGSPITARGVCWGTSANPVLGAGNFTTDGSGTGAFVSSIQGLNSNTIYHVRAYATNAFGTFYGNSISFQTLCGIISNFPWTEGFENGGNIPSCWTQEQVNSSGINWQFITGNGTGYPANAYSGSYNACLKDNTAADNKTRLITPPLNLSSVSNPVLTFYHTQVFWSPDQDILTVFYRTSASGNWTQLAQYTSNVTTWTLRTISLPNPSAEYYIAFEGNAKYGRGVCIDEVSVNGTSLTPSLSVSPSNQNQSAAAGSVNFTVTSNVNWSAVSNQSWCSVTANGSGNGTLTATLTENTEPTQRIAQITVSAQDVLPVIVTVTQAGAALTAYANVLLRPLQIDLSSVTSQSAVLMQVGNYSNNDVKYRIFNGSNQYNVWDGAQFVTSSTYANNPSIPGSPSTSSIWWIIHERGSNNSTAGSYRDRLTPYSANHLTTVLPSATAVSNPVNIGGTIPFTASYSLAVKYVILGFDQTTGGNLVSATSSELNSGVFNMIVENGTVIRRLEVRSILNELMESQTGTWPSGAPPALFTFSGGGSYCSLTIPSGISATLSGSETSSSYQLLRDGLSFGEPITGTGNPLVWNNLTAGTYNVTATNSNSSQTMTGQAIVTETAALPVSISIQATQSSICQGTSVSFSATAQNPGTSPVYQWLVNGQPAGTNSLSFAYSPSNGDQVQLQLTSSETCLSNNPALSNTIIMTVLNPVAATIAIQAATNQVCQGTSVNFSAAAQNPGTSPVYQWLVNGQPAGTNSTVFSYSPANNDQVQLQLTSSETCVSNNPVLSNIITMQVTPVVNAIISISAAQQQLCNGQQADFTTFILNGGTNPVIQWRVNSINVGTNAPSFSYVPANNDMVDAVLTSNLVCATNNPATSNLISLEVLPNVTSSVSIEANPNPSCNGANVTLTATPVNGGSNPTYQWKLNGLNFGSNSNNISLIPNNGDLLQVIMGSSLSCATGSPASSNVLSLTVLPVELQLAASPAQAGTVGFTGNPVIGQQVTLTANPANGWQFVNWTNASGAVVSSNQVFAFSIQQCINQLTANFSSGTSLSGKLAYFNPVESAMPPSAANSAFFVQLYDGSNPVGNPQQLGQDSRFSFSGLNTSTSYTIRLWEQTTSGLLNQAWTFNNWGGVTALDALIVSYMTIEDPVVASFPWIQTAPGQAFSPLFFKVADANNSNGLTALDALLLMFRSVGHPGTSPFPGGRPDFQLGGKIIPSAASFTYPLAPDLPFDLHGAFTGGSTAASVYYQAEIPTLQNGSNFLNLFMIATGDMNASMVPSAQKSAPSLQYNGVIGASMHDVVRLPVFIDTKRDLAAFSLSMKWNPELVEVSDVKGPEIFAIDAQNQTIKIAWMDKMSRTFGPELPMAWLELVLLKPLQANDRFLELLPETELADVNAQSVKNVAIGTKAIASDKNELFKLSHLALPNPFNESTAISFSLPAQGNVTLSVFNALGQLVHSSQHLQLAPGENTLLLSKNQLTGAGAYSYQLMVEANGRLYVGYGKIVKIN